MTLRRIGGLLLFLALLATAGLRADELPPQPKLYFSDEAHVVDAQAGARINEELAQFERDSASQIVVAIYPSLPAGQDLALYCTRTAQSWVTDRRNGQMTGDVNAAVLFVFVNDHKMFIATGRDLQGALPDITCKEIIDEVIKPHFTQETTRGGVQAGVDAMKAAAQGQFHGTGMTVADQVQQLALKHQQEISVAIFIGILILLFVIRNYLPTVIPGPYVYTSGGYGRGYGGWGGTLGGGGSFGGGGGGPSSFGGFSGGGGGGIGSGFNGGGAGGSW